ncbi:MAG: hypothetical protein HC804_10070 [Anaerolineae bacterium]|nr:hypothetical protein [Anaerolineae bacterium]
MKLRLLLFIVLGIWFLTACAQELVEVTRVVEVEKEVEVTRQVEIEVTREVEVMQDVEVTREIEVTREVEVEIEVTRLVEVEVEVTAVPSDTPTPVPTNTPVPTSVNANPAPTSTPAVNTQQLLLTAMTSARNDMLRYGGLIDGALRSGGIDCRDVVDTHDRVASAPTFDTNAQNDLVKNAYGAYRAAIDILRPGHGT